MKTKETSISLSNQIQTTQQKEEQQNQYFKRKGCKPEKIHLVFCFISYYICKNCKTKTYDKVFINDISFGWGESICPARDSF